MKKRLLTIALSLATTVVFGQIEEGTKILGGTFSYNGTTDKNETVAGGVTTTVETPSSSMTLIPSFGYMFKENMGAGIRLGIDNSSTGKADMGSGKTDINQTIVGLFGRYYIDVAGDALYFHTDLVLDFGFGTWKNTDEVTNPGTSVTTERSLSSMQIGLRPGWDYFIGDKWAIEMNWGFLGYTSSESKFDDAGVTDTQSQTSFDIDFDFSQFQLGARWYF